MRKELIRIKIWRKLSWALELCWALEVKKIV